jgi:hypothetical protein
MSKTSEVATKIAQHIIRTATTTGKVFSVEEILASGVTGDLFGEVYDVLAKAQFVVETFQDQDDLKEVRENILKCQLKQRLSPSEATAAELKMLKDPGEILIGLVEPTGNSTIRLADSGKFRNLDELDFKDFQFADLEAFMDRLCVVSDELKAYEPKGNTHKVMN